MRITNILHNNTEYGKKKRDVILTTGGSIEDGYHIYASELLRELSESDNDIVIAGAEPLEQYYPMISFLELVKKHTDKRVWLVTSRDVTLRRKIWTWLLPFVDVVKEVHTNRIINLRESVEANEIILWEE